MVGFAELVNFALDFQPLWFVRYTGFHRFRQEILYSQEIDQSVLSMRLVVLCHLSYFWVGLSASRIHHLVERLIFEQSSRFEVETLITFCVRRKMPVHIAPRVCPCMARITLAGMQYGACRASWPDSLYIRHWAWRPSLANRQGAGVFPAPPQTRHGRHQTRGRR